MLRLGLRLIRAKAKARVKAKAKAKGLRISGPAETALKAILNAR